MKKLLIASALILSTSAFAEYTCHGAKGTAIEKFQISKLSATELETDLDGRLDVAVQENNFFSYVYNNGCDNDITFRIHKLVMEGEAQSFNLRMDYYGPDDILTDTEVLCYKTSK